MIEDNIRRKVEDLIARSPSLIGDGGLARSTHHLAMCEGWITEALNVVRVAIPTPDNPYRVRIESKRGGGAVQRVAIIAQMLRTLLPDIDSGILGDLGNRIRAETFDDLLDHAQAYLDDGRKVAGVIAGVVFEDTVRRIHRDKIGPDKGQSLENLINALAGHGVMTAQQSKQAKVAAHVRTKATHALWEEFDLLGVKDTIQTTKLFLRDHLGG